MITPQQAAQELAARAAFRAQQNSQQITPEQARQELAARQAFRAQQQQPVQQPVQTSVQQQPQIQQQVISSNDNGAPSFFTPFISNKEAAGAANQLAFSPERAGKVAAASTLNTAEGLTNLLANIAHYGTLGISPKSKMNVDYNKELGVDKQKSGDTLLAMAPLMAIPEGIPTKELGTLGKLAARVTEGEAYGQAAGANKGTGAATATAISIPDLLTSAIRGRNAIPAALLKGTATAEERAANAKAAGNLPLSIGKITESPVVNKAYENILGEVPFSGVDQQQKAVAEGVDKSAQQLINKIGGNNDSILDPNELLKQRLLNAKQVARDAKNEQYNKVDELAQAEGHNLTLPSFTDRANEVKSALENSPLLQTNPKLKSFMNKMGVYQDALSQNAEPNISLQNALTGQNKTSAPSILEANIAKNDLYNAGDALSKSLVASDRYMGGIYKELSGKISNDIKNSINSTGSQQLQDAFKNATNEYRNNYGKFINKDIFKYLDENKPSDALARQIVKPSNLNDSYSNIKLVKSLLPPQEQNLLSSAYLSNALDEHGQVDASKMGKLVNSLGPRQFNSLFGKEVGKDAENYKRLMSMSGSARNQQANPKTGARLLSMLTNGALFSAVLHPTTIGPSVAGGILASKGLSKYLTSPTVREKLLQQMNRSEAGIKNGIQESDRIRRLMAILPKGVAMQQAQQNRGQ